MAGHNWVMRECSYEEGKEYMIGWKRELPGEVRESLGEVRGKESDELDGEKVGSSCNIGCSC